MKHKWLRTFCALAAALVLCVGIGIASPLVADARGSGGTYASPKSGYKTGGYTTPKSGGGTGGSFFGGSTGGSFFSGSTGRSSNHFFFFPSFFHFGGYGTGFSALHILRYIIIAIVIILIIRWIIRRRRRF
ncbi:MAG: hypothetical protein ABF904_00840 [Ethanoligenens sp.]